ncbi:hypothetical protein [Persicobacter diffluens]|uniref:Uncharacterized protein n=1 Tax=Persicobacter diffluens TaxID=981 RepID=A0AAN5APS7_9BACT|nr:hypothetical protein PEDI_47050 [Persicobacter diffluens]
MAVYDKAGVLKEMPIYGSQRIGMIKALDTEGEFTHGNRQYEYSNHLGNVLAVSSDKMVKAGGEGDLISASNYYPFGLPMGDQWSLCPTG